MAYRRQTAESAKFGYVTPEGSRIVGPGDYEIAAGESGAASAGRAIRQKLIISGTAKTVHSASE
jgi:hypothetical protein